jgi:hypothetical protein
MYAESRRPVEPLYRAQVISTKVICQQPGRYIGWPSIVRRRSGELLVVFSGDRDAHVCPWGKTQLVRSLDGGVTWSREVTVNNTPLDDRDAGVIETAEGTIIVSWFTSVAFTEPRHIEWQGVDECTARCWRRHAEKLTPGLREQWLGSWVRRSEDGGVSWDDPTRLAVSAPHGMIQLTDGRLLYVGTMAGRGEKQALGVEASLDDGRSWSLIATIGIPEDESINHYSEPHVVELPDGRLVAMVRYQPPDVSHRCLRQSQSSDGGRTWSTARPTSVWGYPPHLMRLQNDWLLVVYGRRISPFGERACISRDGGATWDVESEITLQSAPNDDLGYPCSAQLGDGSILTVYYQVDENATLLPWPKTSLMCTHWRLDIA